MGKENITIRGHHLEVVRIWLFWGRKNATRHYINYQSEGYGRHFRRELISLLSGLTNDLDSTITVVANQPDSICANCPPHKKNPCFNDLNSDLEADVRAIRTYQLEVGASYTVEELTQAFARAPRSITYYSLNLSTKNS